MFKKLLSTLTSLSEAETKDTKTGRIHKGDYGTSHEAGDEGVKKQETNRGRGRPKKDSDETTGEVKKYDTKSIGAAFGAGQKPKKDIGTVSKKHSLKEYIDSVEEFISEGETIEKKGGRIHKGSYGTSHEAGDEGVKKQETNRGRGRPKKDSDEQGEVKKYDTKSIGSAFGAGKAPKKPVGKVSASHKLKETEALTIKPIPGASQITGPDGKSLGTADAATANVMKQAAAQGKLTLGGQEQGMAEGSDEGKPGKNFAKIAKSAGKHYGSKEAGERVAGAIRNKLMKQGKLKESLSFNEMSREAQEDAQEMLAELQDDIERFVNTGHCSEKLEAFLKVHGHAKKKITDEGSIQDFTTHGMDSKPSKFVAVPSNPKPTPFSVDPIQATTDRAGSFIKSIMTPKKSNPFAESTEMKDIQLESWESQLNSLLTEGITVSSSTGQQGSPDSVSVNATDADAQQLLQVLRQAGVGVFGGDQPASNYGAPMNGDAQGTGTQPEMSPTVVDDGDGMMALIKKMTGIQDGSDQGGEPAGTMTADYEDEEGSEEHGEEQGEEEVTDEGNMFTGNLAKARAQGKEEADLDGDGDMEKVDEEDMEEGNMFTGNLAKARAQGKDEADLDGDGDMEKVQEQGESCNECGMNESGCECDEEQVEEGYANEAGHDELAQLRALLNMGNDMHRVKSSQATGNIQKVTMETKLMKNSLDLISDWKKLSGIK